MKNLLASVVLAAFSLAAQASGSVLVGNLGPLTSGNFTTYLYNGSSGNILRITFDTSTAPSLVGTPITFGGLNSIDVSGLNGGSATLFGLPGDTTWGFQFTGFGPNERISFSWDPDTVGNGNYGATVAEFIGARLRADMQFGATNILYAGTMEQSYVDVAANLAPVPEPTSQALLMAGLMGVGWLARRRAQHTVTK